MGAGLRVLAILLFGLLAMPAAGEPLVLDARLRWAEDFEGFGGYSALAVLDGGARFVAISDRGSWAEGRLTREDGRLTGVEMTRRGPLLDPFGAPVKRYDIDAEGIAVAADGTIYVSFEANHRVWAYGRLDAAARELARVPDYALLQNNSSLEALAIGRDGRLFTIPERSGALTKPFPVYVYDGRRWSTPYSIRRDGGPWLISGADFGPDGRLYVLERDFALLGGFRSRIRRFTLGADGFGGEEVLLETGFGDLDNMEGIDVWTDADGVTRITMISDDNQSLLQQTILVEYLLDDTKPSTAPQVSVRPRRRQTLR